MTPLSTAKPTLDPPIHTLKDASADDRPALLEDLLKDLVGKSAYFFEHSPFVYGGYLSDRHYACLGQVSHSLFQENISRDSREFLIRGKKGHHGCLDVAPVQKVILNDHGWSFP